MKLVSLKLSIVIFFCLWVLPTMVGSASAHRVNVFAWVDGDMIYVESKFSGGKKVKAGKIIVMDPQGVELLSGLTNDQGEYSFKVPKQSDLRIILIAGQGHQSEWTIRAAELRDLPSKTPSENSTVKTIQPQPQKAVSKTSEDTVPAAPGNNIQPRELEAVIESVLDRKLKPITRMLADIRQEGPTAGDIFAGIGYIFGLVGIVAYVQSRKKKE